MKIRLVQLLETREWVVSEFADAESAAPAFKVRGYEFKKLNQNARHRAELQGQPVFSGLAGPMWDGDAIRYEDARACQALST
jgi:hypothetical protein